jgi:hypothetical protein
MNNFRLLFRLVIAGGETRPQRHRHSSRVSPLAIELYRRLVRLGLSDGPQMAAVVSRWARLAIADSALGCGPRLFSPRPPRRPTDQAYLLNGHKFGPIARELSESVCLDSREIDCFDLGRLGAPLTTIGNNRLSCPAATAPEDANTNTRAPSTIIDFARESWARSRRAEREESLRQPLRMVFEPNWDRTLRDSCPAQSADRRHRRQSEKWIAIRNGMRGARSNDLIIRASRRKDGRRRSGRVLLV